MVYQRPEIRSDNYNYLKYIYFLFSAGYLTVKAYLNDNRQSITCIFAARTNPSFDDTVIALWYIPNENIWKLLGFILPLIDNFDNCESSFCSSVVMSGNIFSFDINDSVRNFSFLPPNVLAMSRKSFLAVSHIINSLPIQTEREKVKYRIVYNYIM